MAAAERGWKYYAVIALIMPQAGYVVIVTPLPRRRILYARHYYAIYAITPNAITAMYKDASEVMYVIIIIIIIYFSLFIRGH